MKQNFIQLSNSILKTKKLSSNDKIVFSYIASYIQAGQKFYASNDHISNSIGVSVSTVARSLTKLRKLQYIEIRDPKKSSRSIELNYNIQQSLGILSTSTKTHTPKYSNNHTPTTPQYQHQPNIYRPSELEDIDEDDLRF